MVPSRHLIWCIFSVEWRDCQNIFTYIKFGYLTALQLINLCYVYVQLFQIKVTCYYIFHCRILFTSAFNFFLMWKRKIFNLYFKFNDKIGFVFVTFGVYCKQYQTPQFRVINSYLRKRAESAILRQQLKFEARQRKALFDYK